LFTLQGPTNQAKNKVVKTAKYSLENLDAGGTTLFIYNKQRIHCSKSQCSTIQIKKHGRKHNMNNPFVTKIA